MIKVEDLTTAKKGDLFTINGQVVEYMGIMDARKNSKTGKPTHRLVGQKAEYDFPLDNPHSSFFEGIWKLNAEDIPALTRKQLIDGIMKAYETKEEKFFTDGQMYCNPQTGKEIFPGEAGYPTSKAEGLKQIRMEHEDLSSSDELREIYEIVVIGKDYSML